MADNASHVYVTRYGIKNSDPDWYAKRLDIFKRYTLPSVQAQTDEVWGWVLQVDDSMPSDSFDELWELVRDDERIVVGDMIVQFENFAATRLDSDDIVANDFTAKVKELIEPGKMVNFNRGYYLRDGVIYQQPNYPNNMFLTVWDERGPYHDQHTRMNRHFEVIEYKDEPMWVHLYHEETYTAYRKRKKRLLSKDVVHDVDYSRFPSLDVDSGYNVEVTP